MKKIALLILLSVLLITQCRDPGEPEAEEWLCTSFAEQDLHGTWSSACIADGGGGSFRIDLTFAADGGFERWERSWSDDTCSGGPLSEETINKSYTIEGSLAADPCVIKLQYLDNTDSIVYALYTLDSGELTFADDPGDYPSNLTAGIDYIQ